MIRTLDSGKTWAVLRIANADTLDFRGVWAWDADTAFVMSSGKAEDGLARVYRTRNGGKDWALALEQKIPGTFFDAIAFWDRQHGIVLSDPVEGHFRIFLTDDGGDTWRPVSAPSLPGEGAFAASNSCLIVEGEQNVWFGTGGAPIARVFRSSDRGRNWAVADTPIHPRNASSGIFSLAFRSALNGTAVGGDYAHPLAYPSGTPLPNAISTSDGGKSWQSEKLAPIYLSSVVYKPRTNEAIAAGSQGIVVRHAVNAINVNALAFAPRSPLGWAVGPGGVVFRQTVAIQERSVGTSGKPAYQ